MASQYLNSLQFVGLVGDPTAAAVADGMGPQLKAGHETDQLVDDLHGKYYTATYRGKGFEANVVTQTMPVVAANLVSVFTLFNPASSGVNAELVDVTVSQYMAATVVDQVGWYYSPVTKALAGTFTTLGTPNNGMVGNSSANKTLFYSAYTHSGTPTLVDVVGSFGALTNVTPSVINKQYDGRLILPPGIVMSLAMATAAGTTTGTNIETRWIEWPL